MENTETPVKVVIVHDDRPILKMVPEIVLKAALTAAVGYYTQKILKKTEERAEKRAAELREEIKKIQEDSTE